ncbi:MAG: HIRAN domain-containing protein [Anaerolineaceae bacterium]
MKNIDGTDRQEIISETVDIGDYLVLKREPANPYDHNAIAVYSYDDQIGYLSENVAEELAPLMDAHWLILVTVADITGGNEGESFGVNIEIEKLSPLEVDSETETIRLKNMTNNTAPQSLPLKEENKSEKNFVITLLLCLFLGFLGIHRWYVGRGSWLYTLTLGYATIGWLVDLITIIIGKFKDEFGMTIKL